MLHSTGTTEAKIDMRDKQYAQEPPSSSKFATIFFQLARYPCCGGVQRGQITATGELEQERRWRGQLQELPGR